MKKEVKAIAIVNLGEREKETEREDYRELIFIIIVSIRCYISCHLFAIVLINYLRSVTSPLPDVNGKCTFLYCSVFGKITNEWARSM